MRKYTAQTYTRNKYEQDTKLVKAVENSFLTDFQDPFAHMEQKRRILREVLSYKNLRVASDKSEIRFLPLKECHPKRITNTLKKRYESASKRIEELGDPSKRIKRNPIKQTPTVTQNINPLNPLGMVPHRRTGGIEQLAFL